ncbi:MAG TPA: HEAT repeat domain-containing protein [Spirochaetota bacterium]|nr:HEAT repeat domain-containing protein [Spirochaetota bacterium]
MKKYLFLALVILSSQFYFISAQTLELDFLMKKEAKINAFYNTAMTTKDRNKKLQVLESIMEEYEKEKFSIKDKKILEIAEKLAMEGVFDKEYENNRLTNNFPEVRVQAVRLLAKLGGDNQRDLVLNIFINDDDLEIKAEACEAFITFGENANGDVVRTVIFVYRKYLPRYPKLIFTMIRAMREFVLPSSPTFDEAIYLLTEISTGSFSNTIKDKAKEAINHIVNKPIQ